ncbi:MAG TPA: exodeoxyribonuclease VII large subunit [Planctomycetaceae bacterium]
MQPALPEPLSVSELTRQVKELIEGGLPFVLVQGEVSNFVRAGSGHLYLTLKDESAQLRAVMWRGSAARLRFEPEDGLQVLAAGGMEVYAARGSYQLVIEELLPIGVGPLELAFRQLHDRLAAEGLFAPERKRPLPLIPRRIALVTSPTGAAVRDMLQVLTRRWPGCDVVVVPVPVQGADAAPKIAAALRTLHRIPGVEVVITGRGGGSLEDLWAFNEEAVARAIFECKVPVVSAVGHEIDVTIADLVADRRALTPSEAAELVVPNAADVRFTLDRFAERLAAALRGRAGRLRMTLDGLAARRCFAKPFEPVRDRERRLDELDAALGRAMRRVAGDARAKLAAVAARLDALNPLAVLARGYSITFREGGTIPLTAPDGLAPGDLLRTRLASGEVLSEVRSTEGT